MASLAFLKGVGGLGNVLSLGGGILSGVAAISKGNTAGAVAEYEAAQLEAVAKTEVAVSQREAAEERRQKDFIMSRARAVAAASGGGQDVRLMGAIEEEGDLRAMLKLWKGVDGAKGRKAQAAAARVQADQMRAAGIIGGFSTILSGAASFADGMPLEGMYEKFK